MTEFVTYNIDKDTEVDWCRDYNVNALNLDSLVFENCSDFCADDNVVIHIVAPYDVESNAENVDEFDKNFPPKEKLKLPGQLFD